MYKKLITNKGFTLLELVVVIAVVAILAVAVAPNFLGQIEQSHVSKTLNDYDTLKKAVLIYHADTASYPSTSDDLLTNPGLSTWQGPYVDRMPSRATYTNDLQGNIYLSFTGLSSSVATTTVTHLGDLATLTEEGFDARLVGTLPASSSSSGIIPDPGGETMEIGGQNYIIVRTAEDLNNVRNELNAYYIQMEDIDLSGYASGDGWDPIGSWGSGWFEGAYDGNGFTISNLTINQPGVMTELGLFGVYCCGNGFFRNITIENASIVAHITSGILVGDVHGIDEISNCHVSGEITGDDAIGGLVGALNDSGVISRSSSKTNVTGVATVGGLVGYSKNTTYENNFFIGNTAVLAGSNSKFGGLIGQTRDVQITNCYAATETMESASDLGGLVGDDFSGTTITSSYHNGEDNSLGTFKTTEELKLEPTFTGWDFSTIWGIDASINDGFPYLQ